MFTGTKIVCEENDFVTQIIFGFNEIFQTTVILHITKIKLTSRMASEFLKK
jgi:hypothetical protein